MMRIEAVVVRHPQLHAVEITDWVARGWVLACGQDPLEFTETDVSRLLLLRDLRVEMALDDDAVPLVLSLLDQLYGLRRTLNTVISVVGEAPDDVKRRVIAALRSSQ